MLRRRLHYAIDHFLEPLPSIGLEFDFRQRLLGLRLLGRHQGAFRMSDSQDDNIVRFGMAVDPHAVYFYVLGQFVYQYAKTEAAFHLVLRWFTGLPDRQHRALIGAPRIADLTGAIRRLAVLSGRDEEDIKLWDEIYSRLNTISQLRDRLVHRGADVTDEGLLSTNSLTAKTDADIEFLRLQISDIDAATTDLASIAARVLVWGAPPGAYFPKPMLDEARAPWRYKPVQPETPNRPPQTKRRSRERPPPSSLE
jgi:hypothetical protein